MIHDEMYYSPGVAELKPLDSAGSSARNKQERSSNQSETCCSTPVRCWASVLISSLCEACRQTGCLNPHLCFYFCLLRPSLSLYLFICDGTNVSLCPPHYETDHLHTRCTYAPPGSACSNEIKMLFLCLVPSVLQVTLGLMGELVSSGEII